MSNLRNKRGFTMVELIIVIVILGILAAIAIVGYQAVVTNARKESVKKTAQAFEHEYRAVMAFDANYSADVATPTATNGPGVWAKAASADVDSNVAMLATAGTGTTPVNPVSAAIGAGATNLSATASQVQFTKDGYSSCLALPTTPNNQATPTLAACTF